MPLADYQHQVNGGPIMGPGTVYVLQNVTGMGLGPKDPKRYGIAGAAGYRWGREHRRGNLVTFDGYVEIAGNDAAAYQAWLALKAAWDGANHRTTPDAVVAWIYKMPGAAEATVLGRTESLEPDLAQLKLGLIPFQGTFESRLPLGS